MTRPDNERLAVAVIDIGSNSVRLMLNGKKSLATTRLAAGLANSGVLSESSMDRSVAAIRAFKAQADECGAPVFAYATSAVRDAGNSADFLARVGAECGVAVDVLTGEREAAYAFLGAAGGSGGLMDVGGGSCQLVSEGFALSFPIGCVRGRDIARGDTLEEQRASLYAYADGLFKFPRIYIRGWTGVGGTITTLAALDLGLAEYDPNAVTGSILTAAAVERLITRLYRMGEERSKHPLLCDRHDVILYGAMIVARLMQGVGVDAITVSDADGMEGYAMWKLGNTQA